MAVPRSLIRPMGLWRPATVPIRTQQFQSIQQVRAASWFERQRAKWGFFGKKSSEEQKTTSAEAETVETGDRESTNEVRGTEAAEYGDAMKQVRPKPRKASVQRAATALPPKRPRKQHDPIQVPPPKPSSYAVCKDTIAVVTSQQLKILDPTGARTRLFARDNVEAAQVGDILMVRLKTGEPFAGVCMNIRRQGIDTAILLRGQLTRVGVECWYKIYSPNVEGIEVVQRAAKRARRARLYYLRQPRHDIGSVENIVRAYLRKRALLGQSEKQSERSRQSRAAKKGRKF